MIPVYQPLPAPDLSTTQRFWCLKGPQSSRILSEQKDAALEGPTGHDAGGSVDREQGRAIARRIGISSGGSGSEVAAAAKAGVDTFITGEGPHWSFPLAEELGINVLYGGHYATETFGVKALAAALETQFGLPWSFVDHPTGL